MQWLPPLYLIFKIRVHMNNEPSFVISIIFVSTQQIIPALRKHTESALSVGVSCLCPGSEPLFPKCLSPLKHKAEEMAALCN